MLYLGAFSAILEFVQGGLSMNFLFFDGSMRSSILFSSGVRLILKTYQCSTHSWQNVLRPGFFLRSLTPAPEGGRGTLFGPAECRDFFGSLVCLKYFLTHDFLGSLRVLPTPFVGSRPDPPCLCKKPGCNVI